MAQDTSGFFYPLIEETRCINCHQCVKTCPQNSKPSLHPEGTIYAALAVSDILRESSSSGGVFSVIAKSMLRKNGVVFGATLDRNLSVRHTAIKNESELPQLRGSKYVQSYIGDSYKIAKEYLEKGKAVLFSGTPCQIDALYHFLGKDYKNLLTIDILCHGVSSPIVFRKFIDNKETSSGKKVIGVNFREKDPGWGSFSTSILYDDGTKEIDNSYYYFFVKDFCNRGGCANCAYAKPKRIGDITLGDFWGYRESTPEHIENDDRGISFVSINTEKGKKVFKSIKRDLGIAKRTIEEASLQNPILRQPALSNERSKEFWEDFPKLNWDELAEKYSISREKKEDHYSKEDREYYARPYKQRHRRHLIHCAKNSVLNRFRK
jgi:coenzyme F420-reducing hydrogenase beta subunit